MQLRDAVVVITGASEGIGAACAACFAEKGARLSLNALPGADFPPGLPDDTVFTWGDITRDEVRKLLVERTLERFGRIDILVNNAGVGLYAPPSETPLPLAERMFALNVFAPLALAQQVVPVMRRQGGGSVVNVASIGSKVSLPWATLYCASKYAIAAISDGLRRELKRSNIHVTTVYPGIVRTRFREHVLAGEAPERVSGIQRVISPEECARAIVRGVERKSRSVVVPKIGYAFAALDRLFPAVMDAYLMRLDAQQERRVEQASAAQG
ncbi:MAG TPA: SDR family NAD(P)-dependent oxidoreductase [Bryobacteraceae bacterium]|nr:SDR family NAD(P)-dependent oxidoreductase [Bryobacteraceae bacterium]HPU70840.1 SDR family NAD(P)-dependent oxidoreductase [Bryobacteraceae bacterium]